MDYYTVEFRIYGANLDIEDVSRDLGLKTSTFQIQGARRDGNTTFRESMWGYGKGQANSLTEWNSLEIGIIDILADLQPVGYKLANNYKNFRFVFWCGHFHDTFGAGPTLSSQLLSSISRLGASLEISTYYDDDKEIV